MGQGLCVTRLIDGELVVVLWNRRGIELLGFPNAIQGEPQSFESLLRYNAERGEYGPGDVDELVQSRLKLALKFEPHQFYRTRPDGTVIEVIGRPLPSGDGFITTYSDVTERQRAADLCEILVQALDGTNAGVAIFDPNDRLMFCNATMRGARGGGERLVHQYGITFEEFVSASVNSGLVAGIAGREKEWLQARIEQHRHPQGPLEVERKNDVWLLVNDIVLESGHTVIISNDISELKKSEKAVLSAKEEADLANRAKTEFLANMSHELRTPLNSVIGFSELMMTTDFSVFGIDKIKEYLTDINHSGRHLLRLISDVLDISKIEVGELILDEEEICLHTLISECMRMISERARRAGTKITINDVPPLTRLYADPTRVKQIVLNLMTNAVKFTGDQGTVVVSWTLLPTGDLALEIRDTGAGMDDEGIKVALEPFGQVANAMTRDHEGAGLGLPLSLRLAKLHQGSLEIESAVGVGTTVRVTFPKERVIQLAPA